MFKCYIAQEWIPAYYSLRTLYNGIFVMEFFFEFHFTWYTVFDTIIIAKRT